jgi:hypothetical protein
VKRERPHTPDPASIPERIAALLHVVRILLGYGRHLADTVRDRAAAPGFPAIAACFGTLDLSVIFARLRRGMLRAVALERVLLARAARGRDVPFARSRVRTRNEQPAPAGAPANRQPVARKPARWAFDFQTVTLKELERQVRRRPIGRTIADICLDLAVVPGLCTGTFWNQLFDAMRCHGGSPGIMLRDRYHREQAFHRQQDKSPNQNWDFSDRRRNMPGQVLGFFIGEQPVLPSPTSATIAAAATGPPQASHC